MWFREGLLCLAVIIGKPVDLDKRTKNLVHAHRPTFLASPVKMVSLDDLANVLARFKVPDLPSVDSDEACHLNGHETADCPMLALTLDTEQFFENHQKYDWFIWPPELTKNKGIKETKHVPDVDSFSKEIVQEHTAGRKTVIKRNKFQMDVEAVVLLSIKLIKQRNNRVRTCRLDALVRLGHDGHDGQAGHRDDLHLHAGGNAG